MAKENSEGFDRVVAFLSKVVPGIQALTLSMWERKGMLEFRCFQQVVGTSQAPWRFQAENMSDGTLRAFGVLTALFQSSMGKRRRESRSWGLMSQRWPCIPGQPACSAMAAKRRRRLTQISVTSHSPDLLDDKDIGDESILAVVTGTARQGWAPLDEAGRSAIRDRLYTVGELLRLNRIRDLMKRCLGIRLPPYQLELFADYKP